jgi:hypothetical protein
VLKQQHQNRASQNSATLTILYGLRSVATIIYIFMLSQSNGG